MPGSTDRGNLGLAELPLAELPLEELWEKIWKQVNLNFLFDFDLRKSANKLWPVSLIINSGDTSYGSQCWLSSLPSFNSSLLNHQKDFFCGLWITLCRSQGEESNTRSGHFMFDGGGVG